MISLARPPHSAVDVYIACAKRTKDKTLKTNLILEADRVRERSELYLSKATAHLLHTFAIDSPVNVSIDQLSDVYERVLVNGGERHIYDELKSRAKFKRCPLCAQRDVRTLDHYLPRADYPELCVTPANLVPCCRDCNSAKHEHVPKGADEQTFHPYFDDWSDRTFLTAEVMIDGKVDVVFCISDEVAPPEWVDRAKNHFKLFELGSLYSQHAAVELVQKKEDFRNTFFAGGAAALKEDLELEARSRRNPFPNAWEPALYRGLAMSEDFCNGGFQLIEQ